MLFKVHNTFVNHIKNLTFSASKYQKCSTKKLGPPWRILFFGTDTFALASLKPLCAKFRTGTLISDLAVVSKNGSIVEKFTQDEKLECISWPVDPDNIKSKYDLGMVVSFGNLIPKNIIESFPLGCINVHASILPKWRGAAPIIHAIMNGDTETGVTVMKIRPHKFDIGEIVRQYRIPIGPQETSQELEKRLAFYGAQLLMECVRDLPKCVQMATPQPKYGVTYAPKINSSMSQVDWNSSASDIYNKHRALGMIFPLKTSWNGLKLKLIDIEIGRDKFVIESKSNILAHKSALDFLNQDSHKSTIIDFKDAGFFELCKEKKSLKVKCNDGYCIFINIIRISGKNISALDFYNGFLSKKSQDMWKFEVT